MSVAKASERRGGRWRPQYRSPGPHANLSQGSGFPQRLIVATAMARHRFGFNSIAHRLLAEHLGVVEEQYRAYLIGGYAEGFLINLEIVGTSMVEPCIGADAPGTPSVFVLAE